MRENLSDLEKSLFLQEEKSIKLNAKTHKGEAMDNEELA